MSFVPMSVGVIASNPSLPSIPSIEADHKRMSIRAVLSRAVSSAGASKRFSVSARNFKRSTFHGGARSSISADRFSSFTGDTLGLDRRAMTGTPGSRNSFLSRPATSSQSEGVSIADFPHPPQNDTGAIQIQAVSARNDHPAAQSLQVVEEFVGDCASQSFCLRQIEHILEDHPEMSAQLNMVKKGLRDHETHLATTTKSRERAFHEQMAAEMGKNEGLQRELKKQTSIVRQRCEMLEYCYKKDEIRLKEINDLTTHLDYATASNEDRGDTIRQLQATIEELQSKLSLVEREQQCERTLHSVEQKLFIQAYRDFALKFESEAMKPRSGQADDATLPMLYNDGLKKQFEIYRAFYTQQEALYRSFFGGSEGEKKDASDDGDRFRSSEYFEHRTGPFSDFKAESDLFRDAYLEAAARLELHNLRTPDSPPFLGDQFVSWMANNPMLPKDHRGKKQQRGTKAHRGSKTGSSPEEAHVHEARESLRDEVLKKFFCEISEEHLEDSDAAGK